MLRLLENSFVSQIFTMLPSPRQNYSPAEGYYSYPPENNFKIHVNTCKNVFVNISKNQGSKKYWIHVEILKKPYQFSLPKFNTCDHLQISLGSIGIQNLSPCSGVDYTKSISQN